jgi:hypothetical protein
MFALAVPLALATTRTAKITALRKVRGRIHLTLRSVPARLETLGDHMNQVAAIAITIYQNHWPLLDAALLIQRRKIWLSKT